ncbi:molybdate ABC transporter substrate-binding protein [Mangrovicella endophytica]|uniref:molybdate ABC transporter substrate-binding protein n=1 Tax=Mangrovicella endophytica TaxID=2066697 RepID=UPI000C9DB9D7|nr:molybdate ABC transporter substrate-binding protein [Mangrovicella endophytica]
MTLHLLRCTACASVAIMLLSPAAALADTTRVAVAANFTDAAKEIAEAFKAKTGDTADLSFGSTGTLYTQISEGAPFEVLLAADDERPARAVKDGFGVDGSVFTYAVGKLVLYSSEATGVKGEDTLKSGDFDKISIADPKAAPYGAAAIETMKALGVFETLASKIVQGSSIAQAYQFVETGNAQLGFVALSQVIKSDSGSRWIVPQNLYEPIRQDAVLITAARVSKPARAFLEFLKGPEARAIIDRYGYAATE